MATNVEILKSAEGFLDVGWQPIPLWPKSKKAINKEWPQSRLDRADVERTFRGPVNIALLLGSPSGGLVDVDVDCLEALTLASWLLPAGCTFGRRSKPRSHYLYTADPVPKTKQFKDTDKQMLVELRSDGAYTMVPPSTHPSGEEVEWEETDSLPNLEGGQLALIRK